ncbi:MAG: hypothetical protein JNM56_40745 [Planctomycetia bacterium]|nr:hypothetical protein [Planctomycetia bacterium]
MHTQQLLDEVTAGKGLTLSQLIKHSPAARRNGRPVTLPTVLRWVLDGSPGPDGKRIKLEAVRMAGRWISSCAALQRWIAAQTPLLEGEPTPVPRTPGKRQRASEKAGKQLDKVGI